MQWLQIDEVQAEIEHPLPHFLRIVHDGSELRVWLSHVLAFTGRRCLKSALTNLDHNDARGAARLNLVVMPDQAAFGGAEALFKIINGDAPEMLSVEAAGALLSNAAYYMATPLLPGLGTYLQPMLFAMSDMQVWHHTVQLHPVLCLLVFGDDDEACAVHCFAFYLWQCVTKLDTQMLHTSSAGKLAQVHHTRCSECKLYWALWHAGNCAGRRDCYVCADAA